MRTIFRLLPVLLILTLGGGLSGCLPGGESGNGDASAVATVPMWQDLLTDISFADSSTGMISGWGGRLLRTTDGGESWVETKTGTETDLNSVAFLTGDIVVAVGSGGKILRSTDAGITWKELDSPSEETLNKVVSAGDELSVAVGWNGTILTSTDDGASWDATTLDPPNNYISVAFSDGVGLMIASGGAVYRTFDGTTWSTVPLPEEANPSAVSIVDGTQVLLVGEFGEMLVSDNAGNDWYESASIMTADLLCASYLGGPADALAGGWDGVMIRTSDGGASWGTVASGTDRPIRSIAARDDETVFAVGDSDTIVVSRDGGYTWSDAAGRGREDVT